MSLYEYDVQADIGQTLRVSVGHDAIPTTLSIYRRRLGDADFSMFLKQVQGTVLFRDEEVPTTYRFMALMHLFPHFRYLKPVATDDHGDLLLRYRHANQDVLLVRIERLDLTLDNPRPFELEADWLVLKEAAGASERIEMLVVVDHFEDPRDEALRLQENGTWVSPVAGWMPVQDGKWKGYPWGTEIMDVKGGHIMRLEGCFFHTSQIGASGGAKISRPTGAGSWQVADIRP